MHLTFNLTSRDVEKISKYCKGVFKILILVRTKCVRMNVVRACEGGRSGH